MIGRHRQMRAELRCDWLRRDTGARSSVSTSVQLTSIQPSPLRPSELGPPSQWPVAPFSSVNSSTQVSPSHGQVGRRLGDWAQAAQLSTLVPPWAGAGLCVVLVPAAAAWWDPATTILVTMEPAAAFSAPPLSPHSHTSRDVIQWKVIAALLLGSGRGLQLGGGGLATSLRMMETSDQIQSPFMPG